MPKLFSQRKTNYLFGIILLVSLVICGLFFLSFGASSKWNGYTSRILLVKDTPYEVWVADNPIKHYQGLSDITSLQQLEGKKGMVFEYDTLESRSFVNRKTYLDLRVVWLKNGIYIGESILPSLSTNGGKEVIVTSPELVNRVVELVE